MTDLCLSMCLASAALAGTLCTAFAGDAVVIGTRDGRLLFLPE